MPYKDKEKAAARSAEWQRTHPERRASSSAKWRKAHREEWNAYQRALYAAHREERRAYMRARYAARKGKNLENTQRLEEEMSELTLERCPRCGSAGGVKVQGRLYVSGCTKLGCRLWLGREDATTAETLAAAVAGWNELARTLREELGEKAVPAPAPEKEARQDASPPFAGEPPAPPGETVETDEASAAEEAPKRKRGRPCKVAGEPAGEPPAPPEEEAADEEEAEEEAAEGVRFLVEVDGTFYWLEEGSEGCEGCAFQSGFGRRTFCGAESVEGLEQASALCRSLAGIWRENEEE